MNKITWGDYMKKFFYNVKKYYKYAIRSAKAELKSEVAGSYLNWLWWIIEPLCFMLIYTFIFSFVFKSGEDNFPIFVFIGQIIWDFFNRMISGSVKLISSNRGLVTKVYIPKYILLLSKSFTYIFKMIISFIITLLLMLIMHVPFTFNMVLVLPIFIVIYIISFGIGLLIMHFGVYVDDLSNLIRIILKMVFYFSGIFYNINKRIPGTLGKLLLYINPIAFVISELRNVLLYNNNINILILLGYLSIGCLLCIIGVHTIHKNENNYAKLI